MFNNKPVSQLYSTSRTQIQHYDMSIGLRLIWLNNSQAFMFGIYSVTTFMKAPTPFLLGKEQALALVIPIIGLVATLFTLIDIITSIVQMSKIRRNYKRENGGKEHELSYPAIYGKRTDRFLQHISPIATALLFMAIWSFLILFDHNLI